MKKGLVIFAAASMLAAGASLASHVSFGQRMSAALANAFEFVGPVSGLVNGLVKPTDAPKKPVVPDFTQQVPQPQAPVLVPPAKGSHLRLPGLAPLSGPMAARPAPALASATQPAARLSEVESQVGPLTGQATQALIEQGEREQLARMGDELQMRTAETISQMARQALTPVLGRSDAQMAQLAMQSSLVNKQIDAGTDISTNLTVQGQGGDTATQLNPTALSREGAPALPSGHVPVPASLALMTMGLVAVISKQVNNKG